jgi:hypothetical protein
VQNLHLGIISQQKPPFTSIAYSIGWYWLRHYAASGKVAGSRSDEVDEFFSIYVIIPAALGPRVYSTSNRNEYQKHKINVSGE